jgi:hypothetical protein
VLGVLLTLSCVGKMQTDELSPDAQRNVRYSRYLTGVGFTLLVLAAASVCSFGGMIQAGTLHPLGGPAHASGSPHEEAAPAGHVDEGASKTSPDSHESNAHGPTVQARVIVLAGVMALVGNLFFVINRLRRKRDEGAEAFEAHKFWSGVWFRSGEAVIFTLVLVWVVWAFDLRANICTLPLLALVCGMFVTSGEKLITGLSNRLLSAASAFVT